MNFMNFFISLKYLPRIHDAGCYEMVRYFKQYYLGGGGELLGINYKISVKYVEWRVVDRPVRGRCVNYFCHCGPWRSFSSNATKDDLVQDRSSLSHIQWKRYKDILKMQRIFGDRTLISGKNNLISSSWKAHHWRRLIWYKGRWDKSALEPTDPFSRIFSWFV